MITDKVLLLSIVGSLFIHGVALYMTGMVQMKQTIPEEKILTVDLKKEFIQEEKKTLPEIKDPARVTVKAPVVKQPDPPPEGKKEDTVDLGDLTNTRYKPYLIRIKKRIERFWGYPSSAAARRIEGTAMIKFSVTSDGMLDEIIVTTSSGSALLDQGTIATIQSASPFEPLPGAYGLSKLNIQASFAYKMTN
jgi:periplasmic protein TonB